MHRRLLKSLVKAHRKIEARNEIILTRITRLEAKAAKYANKNHPEVIEIIDKLWMIRKSLE